MDNTANQPYKPLAVGDYIIVGQDEEYAGLVGQVTEIIRLGTPEHDTGNPTDDIVVDLSSAPYSDYKKNEIVTLAKKLGYDDVESFEDVSLDSIILAPDDIIRITAREYERYGPQLMASMESANELGERLDFEHFNEMYKALTDRVKQNYAEYQRGMLGYSAQDVFDAAARVHAVSDAYGYMTARHNFSEEELRFFLQFKNPLDMLAQHWHERNMDISDMSFTVDFIMEPERQRRMLERYSLAGDAPAQAEQTAKEAAPLTPREQLIEKMRSEYNTFLDELSAKPPMQIIESSYEKVFKEDLLLTVEDGEFSDEKIAALLTQEYPLDLLYQEWLDTDASYMDMLRDCVDDAADTLIKETLEQQPAAEQPSQTKPKTQAATRKPSLLDELRDAAREVEARKAERPANHTKKHDKEID